MNEYPQLGGNYEVVHHSQFLEWLIDTGKLDMSEARLDERIVYHDSLLPRSPQRRVPVARKVIGSLAGVEIVEAERNGTKGHVLRRGGARMWMEESIASRSTFERSQELIATGAGRVATACPFCYIMIAMG